MYLFGGFGIALGGVGFLGFLYLAIRKFVFLGNTFDSPILVLSVMLSILGVQSILLGLIAEIVVRTYHESQSRPIYSVRYVIDRGQIGNKDE
jgi:hypothetical protein